MLKSNPPYLGGLTSHARITPMLEHSARTHRARWTLVVLLLCAFALRLLNLTVQPLWFDEGWSVWFATADLPTMAARTAADIHPPLYYALLHAWIALAG